MWLNLAIDDFGAWVHFRMFGRWMYRDFRRMRMTTTPVPADNDAPEVG